MPFRFRVATRATGHRRAIDVVVYDTAEELRAAAQAYFPHESPDRYEQADGCFQCKGYSVNSLASTAFFGVIRLVRDEIGTEVVAHESAHAAAHMYRADCMKIGARAAVHMHAGNEPLAYAVGDLTQRIVTKLYRTGVLK